MSCKDCEKAKDVIPVPIRIQGNDVATIKVVACPLHLEMMQDILGNFDKALNDVYKNWRFIIDGFNERIEVMEKNAKMMQSELRELKKRHG